LCKLLADIYSGSVANLDDNYLQQDESSLLNQCDKAVAEMTRVMLCGEILVTDWSKQEWWKSVIHSSDCRSVKIRLILHLKEFLSCVKAFKIRVAELSGKDDTLLSHLSEKDDLEYWMPSVENASKIDSNSLLQIAETSSRRGVFPWESQTNKIAKHLLAMLTVSTSDGEHHDRQSIRYDDVQICTDKCLGQGGFGTVFKCTFLGMPAAAKVFKAADHAVSEGVKKEATILAKLQHPNVLQFIGVASNEDQHVIVTELMGMDLQSYLHKSIPESDLSNSPEKPPLKLLEAIDIMLQVAEGMDHLHKKGVIHRDLKAKNVLVNVLNFDAMDGSRIRVSKSVRVKVADFGLSKLKDMSSKFTTLGRGTTPWRAPEVFEGNRERYKKSADVYSFAMLFFEVLTGKTPFDDLPRMTLYRSICNEVRPPLPSETYCPNYLSELIRRCWATRAEDRPEFPEICQMLQYCKGILVRQEFPSHKKCIREYDAQESKGLTVYFDTTTKFESKSACEETTTEFKSKSACEETLFKLPNNMVVRALVLLLSTFVLWSVFYLQIVRDAVISFFTTFLADHLVLFFSRFLSSSLVVHHFVLVFIASSLQTAPSFLLLFCSALLRAVSYLLATLLFLLVFYACFRKITQFISYKYSFPPRKNSFLDTIALPSFVFTMILLFSRLFFQSLKIDLLVFNMVVKISQIFVVVSPIIMIICICIIYISTYVYMVLQLLQLLQLLHLFVCLFDPVKPNS
jgi:serine/threonine protein kinase